jgi:hypothetical protein
MVQRFCVLVLQQAKKKALKKYCRSTVLFYGMDTIRVKMLQKPGLNSYSVQYKRFFGMPDKVRCDTGDQARPLSQVWGVEPNTSSGYELAEPSHYHHLIAGMQDCIPR